MKQKLWAAGCAVLLACAASARAQEIIASPDAIRAHVTFLADDLLEGRGTGTRGHEIAARYVAAQLMAQGIEPAGENATWFQTVTLLESSLGPKGSSLTITGPAGAQSWANATDVMIVASPLEAEQDVEAPVVFVGFGLDAPDQGFDDYRGLDVRGKIVAAFEGAPKGAPSDIAAHLTAEKEKMAQAHGAVGFLELPTLSSERSEPWADKVGYATVPRMTWVDPNGQPQVNMRVAAVLNAPAAVALFAGARRNFRDLQKVAEGGRPRGFALKTTARIQRSSVHRTITSPAVVGLLRGSDPALSNELVVLMAHLDHLGIRPKIEGDKIYNGALDNAAGVATMLEVARVFASAPNRPRRSLLFVANTGEEKGLLGADYFAHFPTVAKERIVSVVNIDMPIMTYDFTDVVAFGAEHSTVGVLTASAAAKMGVQLARDPFPEEGVFVRSDHYALVKQGVPAVMLATGFANGGEVAWGEFFAKRYHKPGDDLSQPISWAAGAKFARMSYLLSKEIADAAERPRWYAGDFFGERFAPTMPKAATPRKGKTAQ